MVFFDPMNEILAFEKKFRNMFSPFIELLPEKVYPPVNLYASDSDILAVVRMPGVNPEDIEVSINQNILTIRGYKKLPDKEASKRESYCGEFNRSVELPVMADPDNVKAELSNGILKLTIAKAKELQPRKIEIKKS